MTSSKGINLTPATQSHKAATSAQVSQITSSYHQTPNVNANHSKMNWLQISRPWENQYKVNGSNGGVTPTEHMDPSKILNVSFFPSVSK